MALKRPQHPRRPGPGSSETYISTHTYDCVLLFTIVCCSSRIAPIRAYDRRSDLAGASGEPLLVVLLVVLLGLSDQGAGLGELALVLRQELGGNDEDRAGRSRPARSSSPDPSSSLPPPASPILALCPG